ncbi:hypothetical protein CYLTODRAFT_415502 [Cylindrobasidium torrendii FP15055 ss-10]|uniref:Uncharacterized protein n=1 Tax=Cylindrobasidium torrendii FP15055 ss-10 TaxID=1314674 RepID=A0A0D7AVP7_9AGAR|nr:hypothetical protein CYLTODRAFT_415502 [Cylindrobasidium torrendii FP15055 ss-10]
MSLPTQPVIWNLRLVARLFERRVIRAQGRTIPNQDLIAVGDRMASTIKTAVNRSASSLHRGKRSWRGRRRCLCTEKDIPNEANIQDLSCRHLDFNYDTSPQTLYFDQLIICEPYTGRLMSRVADEEADSTRSAQHCRQHNDLEVMRRSHLRHQDKQELNLSQACRCCLAKEDDVRKGDGVDVYAVARG